MGRLLIDDFNSQKKNILWILLIAILGAVVGFAFQAIYYCSAILLTAGACLIYFSCFYEYQISEAKLAKTRSSEDNDRFIRISRKKMHVRTKYVEIIFLAVTLYILLSVAFVLDAFDRNLFIDPEFSIMTRLEQIALYPLELVLLTSMITPMLFKKRISKAFFISLALLSIILSYGLFLLDFLTNFTEIKQLMIVLPFPVLGTAVISYFVAISTVIRGK